MLALPHDLILRIFKDFQFLSLFPPIINKCVSEWWGANLLALRPGKINLELQKKISVLFIYLFLFI